MNVAFEKKLFCYRKPSRKIVDVKSIHPNPQPYIITGDVHTGRLTEEKNT